MAKIGGFDPGVGILPLSDGRAEIGRGNLPVSTRLIPGSAPDAAAMASIYGKLTDSALSAKFAPYLATELKHRELLSPDVFFEALESAAEAFQRQSKDEGEPEEGPMVEAMRVLVEVLSDRALCEALRNLIIKA